MKWTTLIALVILYVGAAAFEFMRPEACGFYFFGATVIMVLFWLGNLFYKIGS